MANRSLGTLTVDLVAKVGGFTEGMSKADRETQRRMRSIQKSIDSTAASVRRWTVAGTAAATAAAAVTAAVVNQTRKVIDEQAKLARSLDTTVKGLQVATRAGDLNGVAFSQLEQFTKDLTRRLSQAAAGTGPAVAALDRLQLTAEDLQAVPLDERLSLIRKRLDEMVPAAERAAVAGQLFGEEGSLNALRFTEESIARARHEIDLFGVALSDIDAAKVEQANDALSSLGLIQQGFSNQLTVQVSSLLVAVSEGITGYIEAAGGMEDVVDSLFNRIVVGSIGAAGSIRQVLIPITRGIQDIVDGFNSLPPFVREIGLVGAFLFGKRGFTVLALGSSLVDDFKVAGELTRQLFQGNISLAEWFTDQEGARQKLEDLGVDVENLVNSIGEGPSIAAAIFSGPDELDTGAWEQKWLTWWEEVNKRLEDSARASVSARPAVVTGILPSVPGADANLPAQDPAIVAARAVQGWLSAGEQIKETTDSMSIYAEQAARNMQTAFADFLFNPFDEGLDGMLKSFANTLQRLAAEAAASKIFDAIFSGTTGGLGGILSGIFGGAEGRASGGPVLSGSVYQVGEFNRPELLIYGNRQYLIPGDSGRVVPAGGGGNTQIFNITTPDANSFRASERQIKRRARRGLLA